MKRTENRFFSFKSVSLKYVLPIKLIVLLLIGSLSFISCQKEKEVITPKEVKKLEKVASNKGNNVFACSVPIDSVGILHNIVLERYQQLYNNYLVDNNFTNETISEVQKQDIFTTASLQVFIERCPSQDTTALHVYLNNMYDNETPSTRLLDLKEHLSSNFYNKAMQLSSLNNVSDIVSLNKQVQSSTTISPEEKQIFTVLSSTYQNSLQFWSASPSFGGSVIPMIDVPERLLIDAAGASYFLRKYAHYPYSGAGAVAYGAACSALAKI